MGVAIFFMKISYTLSIFHQELYQKKYETYYIHSIAKNNIVVMSLVHVFIDSGRYVVIKGYMEDMFTTILMENPLLKLCLPNITF